MSLKPILGALLSALLVTGLTPAQGASRDRDAEPLWREVDESALAAKGGERLIVPTRYRVFGVDQDALSRVLESAPMEFSAAARSAEVVLAIPMPDGSTQRFRIQESPVMEPALARQFPEIETFVAQGIDDPAATARVDRTPFGFHAMILSPNGTVFVDPYMRGDTANYVSYYKHDFVSSKEFRCLVEGVEDAGEEAEKGGAARVPNGSTLRTYRLAMAATGEYTAFHGGTVSAGMAAITTTVNRVTGVYELDLAIRMVLVANNSSIVYTNASTDPYSNNSPSTLLNQNQSNLDSVIGSANYDIGHVVGTGGGGLAGLAVVCRSGQKARGETGSSQPIGDPFDIDYVAHEIGHQFGGNHTFNGNAGSCGGGNRNASTAYEVGSGSTIQAYAGICSSQDLQPHSDPYFHGKSYDEMVAYSTTGSGNCAAQTPTGNTPPTVDAGAAYTVPRSTPFALTATASDPNGDSLTYCWEEFDLGAAGSGTPDNGSSPIFRSFSPTSSPTRSFPRLGDVLSGQPTYGETMPTTNRTMNFRVTVRDNRAGGGGVDFDTTTVTSTTSAGPFVVSTANTATSWSGNSAQTVTWDVASTNIAPVSTANVRILFSADGGTSFPFVLAETTPNDGSQAITVPNVATTQGRLKIEAVGNIFFDINNANVTVTATASSESVGVYTGSDGVWYLRNTNTPGPANLQFVYGPGSLGWLPIVGDWNGDGLETPGLFDPSTGVFYLRNSSNSGAADMQFSYGQAGAGWLPLAGDWNGDGIDTIGLYDPVTGVFYLRNTNNAGPANLQFQYGAPSLGWKPLAGDYDGNGADSVGLYDPQFGVFYLRNSNTSGTADLQFPYGPSQALPAMGDWDGNGVDTVGVVVSGVFHIRNTNTPGVADIAFAYGPPGATPLAGDWDGQ